MINNLISSLNKKLQAIEFSKPSKRAATPKKTTYVYRDELSKKKQPPPQQQEPQIKKVKKRVRFAETEPVIISIREEEEIYTESEQRKGFGDHTSTAVEEAKTGKAVRITVKMTKQEACRMLSRCSNGGVLEFKDVAFELMQIPAARVTTAMVSD